MAFATQQFDLKTSLITNNGSMLRRKIDWQLNKKQTDILVECQWPSGCTKGPEERRRWRKPEQCCKLLSCERVSLDGCGYLEAEAEL